jgi:hypothetical protein
MARQAGGGRYLAEAGGAQEALEDDGDGVPEAGVEAAQHRRDQALPRLLVALQHLAEGLQPCQRECDGQSTVMLLLQ